MYRDFQENTINSDGSFGMWIVWVAVGYLIHELYNYMIPWYWKYDVYDYAAELAPKRMERKRCIE